MRKLAAFLMIVFLVAGLAGVSAADGPQIEANPSGEVSDTVPVVSGTGTLWENGEPDGVNGLSSEQDTNVPYSRSADDLFLSDDCPLYDIDVIRFISVQDPGILDAGIEIFADEGGVPADTPFFEQWGYDTKTWVGNWFSRDGYEFEFFTPGLQLPPGTYWLSGINWQGSGQGFWLTASPGWGSQIYFKSEHFGYPNWVPGDQVFGAQYNVAFDIDGQCAGPQAPPNDECDNATVVDTLPFTEMIDTTLATTAPDDPLTSCGSSNPPTQSNSVWYSFTAPEDGTVYVETCGSDYDTVLAMFEGPCGEPWTEIACNDDSCGLQSELFDIPVVGGTTYLIEVTDYGLPGGGMLDFFLDFTATAEPDIRVDPTELAETLCVDEMTTVPLYVCNDGAAPLDWELVEIPGGGPAVVRPKGTIVKGPESVSKWFALGRPELEIQPAAPSGPAPAPEALTFYADRPTFDGDFPGLPVEGYENYNYDPGVLGFGMPLDEFTDNGVWSPGAILPGISFWATGGDPGTELVALGPSSGWGNPDMTVMANFFVEDYIVQFDPPVAAAGMDLTSLLGANYCDVDIYGTGGYLGSVSAACDVAGVFWGVASDGDLITQIVISDQADGAEGADNVAFGGGGAEPGIPWLSENPTGGTVAPGDCQMVEVTFDATGLAPDVYTGNLLIPSNDPDTPEFNVPVELTVDPCAGTIHVDDIAGFFSVDYLGRPILRAYVWVADGGGGMMPFVLVDASIWVPDGGPHMRSRYTKFSGAARFHWGSWTYGMWTLCVDNLTLAGYTYEPGDNVITCMDWYN